MRDSYSFHASCEGAGRCLSHGASAGRGVRESLWLDVQSNYCMYQVQPAVKGMPAYLHAFITGCSLNKS